jgi:DUF1680 family protein
MRTTWPVCCLVGLLIQPALRAADPLRDYPVVPVPFTKVSIHGGFWGPRLETNRDVTVRYDFRKCEETGRIDNFAKAGGLMPGKFVGTPFDDSDVFKVIEGASYVLATRADSKLDKYLDDLIAKIAAAQEKDGYLYSARTIDPKSRVDFFGPERWSNLAVSHELYNVGHLYEAAVAHHLATGKRTLLNVAIKNADLIDRTFGPAEGQRQDPPGHQEIEIGLAKLYRVTGEKRYLNLAKFFLDQRGRPGTGKNARRLRGEYQQDHMPVTEQTEAVGHSVRATYMYSGMADVAALTGDATYIKAIDRLWENVVSKKLYLTGGIGANRGGEAFGADYELPNREAYNETCAAIANCLWNHRMFLLHGDGKYIDVLERTLYNGFLAGVSLSGDQFFYPNPLASDGRWGFNHGSTERSPWFGCACCPVNIVRFFPSIAGYVYAQRGEAIYVNLFANGSGKVALGDNTIELTQETRYPWDGRVEIKVVPKQAAEFPLLVRIPGWARNQPVPSDLYKYQRDHDDRKGPVLRVNGESVAVELKHGFAELRRRWKTGDVVTLELPMFIERVRAHEKVKADAGRVALERGPIVYCVEGVDHDGRVRDLLLPDAGELTAEHRADLLGGVTVLRGKAQRVVGVAGKDGKPLGEVLAEVDLTAIPYYAWCHRGKTEMAVWLPRDAKLIKPLPAPTLAAKAKPSASHCWSGDTVEALNDQVEPESSIDHGVPRFTWWDHRGTTEWVQYDFDKPVGLSAVDVYWFDDTRRGACRVPASWRLLHRQGDKWHEVDSASNFGVAKDKYIRVTFKAVETKALRIEVKLQKEFSGGILEWRVE